jgi:hypothetical protein
MPRHPNDTKALTAHAKSANLGSSPNRYASAARHILEGEDGMTRPSNLRD